MDKQIDISIVIPVFNETSLIEELYSRLKVVCEGLGQNYEIIIVDDGSSDGSHEKLTQLKNNDTTLRIVKFTRNFGQQAAVLAGFRISRGKIIVQLDSDLQNPPEEIPKLLEAMAENIDLVTTVQRKRRDGTIRVLGSRCLLKIGQMLFGKQVKLNLSSFRALRRSVVEKIESCKDRSRYMAVLMSWMGLPTAEIEVEHHERKKGNTKYSFLNLLILAWDLVTGYSSFPLRMVTYMAVSYTHLTLPTSDLV